MRLGTSCTHKAIGNLAYLLFDQGAGELARHIVKCPGPFFAMTGDPRLIAQTGGKLAGDQSDREQYAEVSRYYVAHGEMTRRDEEEVEAATFTIAADRRATPPDGNQTTVSRKA
jgi:hypothetical protein